MVLDKVDRSQKHTDSPNILGMLELDDCLDLLLKWLKSYLAEREA